MWRMTTSSLSTVRADFDRLESPVGWAKARSSRRAHADVAMVGTLRFAHPFISTQGYVGTFRKERSDLDGHPGRTADRRIDAHRSLQGCSS
jgi:hypothetical protein